MRIAPDNSAGRLNTPAMRTLIVGTTSAVRSLTAPATTRLEAAVLISASAGRIAARAVTDEAPQTLVEQVIGVAQVLVPIRRTVTLIGRANRPAISVVLTADDAQMALAGWAAPVANVAWIARSRIVTQALRRVCAAAGIGKTSAPTAAAAPPVGRRETSPTV